MTPRKPKLWQRTALITLTVLVFLLVIGPFLLPIPPIPDAKTEKELADPDSKFIELDGYTLHYKETGSGEPVFLLLHGLGPGLFTWQQVMEPLAAHGRVIAIDRPASGLSERPLGDELNKQNPYTTQFQSELILALMDALDLQTVHLIGNSAGGTLAAYTVLQHPRRFASLTLADAAIYSGGGAPDFIRPLLSTPQLRRIGPLISRQFFGDPSTFLEQAWFDDSGITSENLEGYRKPFTIQNWDRAFWEITLAGQDLGLPEHLEELDLPVLVISGAEDELVPVEESIQIAEEIKNASLVILPDCGHLPQEECPVPFVEAVVEFTNR